MTIDELKLPKKSIHNRYQISCPIDTELFERFQRFTKNYGHGSKKIFIETALKKLLDEVEKK